MAHRILLVEDEEDLVLTAQMFLSSKGYEVRIAGSGLEALEKIEEQIPDLILLDINLPGIDGVETLRRIRQVSQEVKVIIMTAHQQLANKEELERLGISNFYFKLNPLSDVEVMIKNVLG